ncbi:MAG: ABC-type dipeptide transport system, periplasmic component [Planctomycetota bacterium]|nr:ABC-type dipeptide transport system, periplasmic component [Planctomycetota bacterium]
MNLASRFSRLLAAFAVAAAVLGLALIPTRTGLGQGVGSKTVTLPADLLKSEPFDKITLIDDTVWLIDPVSPRPLPVYDPVKDKEKKKADAKKAAAKAKAIAEQGNVGVKKEPENAKAKEDPITEDMVITLREGDIRDFKIKRNSLKRVEYFEDLLLAEGDRLIVAKDFAKAFEHYLLVKARNPQWKGLQDRVDKLLFEEGAWALVDQDRDRGVRLLRELSARKPDFPNLADKLALAYGGRINESFEKGMYPYARRILHDLESISPKNNLVRESRNKFEAKTKSLLDEAEKKDGAEKLDKLTEGLRVWPTYDGAAEKYAEVFKSQPTLDVAVTDLPRPAGPFIRNPAGERVSRLLYLPLLADESEDAALGKLASQLVTSMEVSDIGRKIDLKLKTGPAWSDGSRQVAAIDVVRALSDRAQPRSPGYSARWADLLERVEITDEQQVTIRLNRPIEQPRSLFLGPIGPAHSAWDGRVPTPDGKRRAVGDGPFILDSETDTTCVYRAAPPGTATGAPTSPIRRLREIRFASGNAALGALVRGDISLVAHVPPDRVNALKQDPEIKVGRYTRPNLHRIALDGRNPALRNRTLRRGMAYAIDRKGLLEETILKRPIDEANLPSDGPFATDSYANAANVRPYAYDMTLARMLVAVGKTEAKLARIVLTLEYPAIAEAQAAVPKIAESLRQAGLEITTVERTESELEEAIRSGRKFDLVYRVSKCVEPVWDVGPMLCPGFDAPSDADALAAIASPRIMQLLLQLEHAQDQNSAKELVIQIDRESRDELPIIPLWQLQDFYAYRGRLKGPGETADHLYQGIDQWQIEPWFAKDPW